MRISGNFCQARQTFFNAARVNASIAKKSSEGQSVRLGQKQDTADISPQGKMMNAIETLTKQKDEINERKNKLIADTIDSGKNMKTIEARLDIYEEQLKTIDKQISDIYSQQAKEASEQTEEDKPKKPNEEKTEEQLTAEHFSNLASASDGIKQSQSISAVARQAEGEARVKETEVHMGELHIEILEDKGAGGATVADMIANERVALNAKEDVIDGLMDKASQLNIKQGEKLGDITEELAESRDDVTEKKQDPMQEEIQTADKTLQGETAAAEDPDDAIIKKNKTKN